jgi:hypothetical protein
MQDVERQTAGNTSRSHHIIVLQLARACIQEVARDLVVMRDALLEHSESCRVAWALVRHLSACLRIKTTDTRAAVCSSGNSTSTSQHTVMHGVCKSERGKTGGVKIA